ncbi:MAG: Imm57 family immunity protein [Burkholderiales bacterium]
MASPETESLELAVGLIGISRSDVASDALVNLLGVRLDGAGSEELNCQILIRGAALSRRLERLRTGQVVNRCQSTFLELRKRELADVSDVKVEQVCRSEAEIRSVRDELLKAVKSKVMCEQ